MQFSKVNRPTGSKLLTRDTARHVGTHPASRGRRGERRVEGPSDAVWSTRRRVDEEAGDVSDEGGVTLGDGAVVRDDDATATVEVRRPR